MPELPWGDINKVHWESFTTWEDVARQQGSIDRIIPPDLKTKKEGVGEEEKEKEKEGGGEKKTTKDV